MIRFSLLFSILLFVMILSCDSSEKTYNEGAILYKRHCENCHMEDGSGLEALYPPLAKADMLQNLGASSACIITNGLEGKIIVNGIEYDHKMPPIEGLSMVEITNIVNYINNAWGNKAPYMELQTIEKALLDCKPKSQQ